MNQFLFFTGLIICLFILNNSTQAQGVAINSDGSNADNSAMLDVSSNNKGMLVPRVSIADLNTAAPISAPAVSLLVYNTNVSTGVGYYYWDESKWARLTIADDLDYVDGNGVATQIAFWSDANTLTSDADLYWDDANNRLGIRTSTPSTPLYIDASAHDGTAMIIDRYVAGGVASIQAGPSNEYLMLEGSETTGRVGINFYSSGNVSLANGGGNVGVGTNSPTTKLHVDGSVRFQNLGTGTQTTGLMIDASGNVTGRTLNITNWDDAYSWGDHTTGGYLTSEVDPTWNGNPNTTDAIGRSGFVGIGTTTPETQLHITEDMQIGTDEVNRDNLMTFWAENGYEAKIIMRETPDHGMGIRYNATDNNLYIDRYQNSTTPSPIMTIMREQANIGIGTTNPATQLHTTGTVRFANYTNGFLQVDGSGNLSVGTGSDLFTVGDGLTWDSNTLNSVWKISGNNIYNGNTGNIGIGTSTPTNKLELVDGIFHIEKTDFGFITMKRPGFGAETEWLISPSSNFFSIFSDDALRIRAENVDKFAFGADGNFGATGTGYFQTNLYVNNNVGIGTTSPSAQLHTTGSVRFANFSNGLLQVDANGYLSVATGSDSFTAGNGLSWSGNTLNSVWIAAGNNIYNANSENVGIGTNSPLAKLHIITDNLSANEASIRIQPTGGGSNSSSQFSLLDMYSTFDNFSTDQGPRRTASIMAAFDGGTWGNEYLSFHVGNNGAGNDAAALPIERMRIDGSGNIGIGTDSPSKKLDINGGIIAVDYYAGDGSKGTESAMIEVVEDVWYDVFDGTVNAVYTRYLYFQDGLYVGPSLKSNPNTNQNEQTAAKSKGNLRNTKNITDFGSSQITGNEVWVEFNEQFSEQLEKNAPVVSITSTSGNHLFYITEKNKNGFSVKCDENLNNATFDWVAIAKVPHEIKKIRLN